jgi:hypothetical protein
MAEHECLHEYDFGEMKTKIDYMTEALKVQSIAMDALKMAIDAAVKYQISMRSIRENSEKDRMPRLYTAMMGIAIFFGTCSLVVSLITVFGK